MTVSSAYTELFIWEEMSGGNCPDTPSCRLTLAETFNILKGRACVVGVGCASMPTDKQFRCRNGQCVSSAVRCNGRNDCQDSSDEFACCPYKINTNATSVLLSSGVSWGGVAFGRVVE